MSEMPWSSVLSECMTHLRPQGSELVPRRNALGRLLLEPVAADRDYPSGDLSTMDGYAIAEHRQEAYRIVGENSPGRGSGSPLEPGTARRIFTGAELPRDASRVVPQELTSRLGDSLTITSYPATSFVRRKGSEAKKGAVTLEPGARIGPVEQAILATVGVSSVRVAVRPRVSHVVMGDELTDPDSSSPGLLIRDSNSDLVKATLSRMGYDLGTQLRIGDERGGAIRTVTDTAKACDLLLLSGGASVGDHDHARAALEAAGFQFRMHRVELRPGKPVGIAGRENQWAIILPGNPVSHLVCLHLFVIPILRGLEGEKRIEPDFIEGILEEAPGLDVPGRATLWPARASVKSGSVHLMPHRFLSSGDLIGIAGVDALIFFPKGTAIPSPGAKVLFLPLNSGF